MIPTPAKRRQLFGERQVNGDNDDDENDDDTAGTHDKQICDHGTNQANRSVECNRLTLAEQRMLLFKERQLQMQQQQQQQDDDEQAAECVERAYIQQHLLNEQNMMYQADELGQEDEEELLDEEYVGLDTIEEEDELMIDSDHHHHHHHDQTCDNRRKSLPVAVQGRQQDNNEPGAGPPAELPLRGREDFKSTTTSQTESDEQLETMTTTTFNSLTNMDPQSEPRCDTKQEEASRSNSGSQQDSKANNQRHHQRERLLPSTNRLISEHQARQQQTGLFRALAERQKLLDELGPSERQQVDLMSTTLPTRSRSLARVQVNGSLGRPGGAAASAKGSSGRRGRESTSESRLAGRRRPDQLVDQAPNSTRGGGVPLSSVDLSSMSDRMLDDLLGHIASASSSSLSSNGGESLDSSDFSPSSSSEDEEHQSNGIGTTTANRNHHHTGRLLVRQQATAAVESASHAPSVIGVHEDLDVLLSSRGPPRNQNNCREAHRKSRRRNSGGRDDEDDDDVQDELRVCLNQTGADNQSVGDSLSPIGQPNSNHHNSTDTDNHHDQMIRQLQQQRPDRNKHGVARSRQLVAGNTYTPNAPSPIESSSSSGEPSSSSTLNSSFSLANSSASTSSCYSSAATNGLQASQTPQVSASPRPDQSVEAVLGRMLEALNEVGRAGQATSDPFEPSSPSEAPQEQLNDLLERGFLHLEQLLNCSLAPGASSLSTSGQQQSMLHLNDNGTMNRSQQQQQHKLISSTLMSKDSDYGSDTQSADCYASSQMLSGGGSGSTSGQQESDGLSVDRGHQRGSAMKLAPSGGAQNALSPLAIDLSFKLAESLRRLAQQQQAARERLLVSPSDDGSPATDCARSIQSQDTREESVVAMAAYGTDSSTTTASETLIRPANANKKKAPMKSIVMINSTPATSTLSVARDQQQKQQIQVPSSSKQVARNLTPDNRLPDDQIAINNSNNDQDQNNIKSSTPTTTTNSRQACKTCVSVNVAPVKTEQAWPNEQQVTFQQVTFERRRTRTSLRRRPSFTGSVGSVRELGAARPGSPVPRAALEVPANVVTVASPLSTVRQQQQPVQASDHLKMEPKQQQQLQRVLVLGQKYNYSPAKLAASKLSSKLQLKDYQTTGSTNNATKAADEEPALDAPPTKQTVQELDQQTRISGRVKLDVGYFAKSGSLTVHLMECQQLAAVSKRRTTSNPYVKLYLLPDRTKSGKRKSSLKRNELSPKFDERFTFGPLQLHEFDSRCLWLSVWHKDRLGRNEFLGELLLPLVQVRRQLFSSDLCQSTSPKWYQLSDRLQLATVNNAQVSQVKCEDQSKMAPGAPLATSAEQVAKKLSEFERKAARLAQAAAVAPPSGHQHTPDMINYRSQHVQANKTISAPPPDMMNVTLGPEVAPISSSSSSSVNLPTGQLFVALKFVPESGELLARRTAQMEGELRVLIKEAHNLTAGPGSTTGASAPTADDNKSNNLPSPMAKCYLLDSNGHRLAKQKTSQLKRTANPRWDHECSFGSLKLSSLQAQAIEIHLFNRDSILSGRLATTSDASNLLGSIRLCKSASTEATSTTTTTSMMPATDTTCSLANRSSSGDSNELCSEREARLWSQMLARPNIWVYGELPLRHLRALVPRQPADS